MIERMFKSWRTSVVAVAIFGLVAYHMSTTEYEVELMDIAGFIGALVALFYKEK